MNDIQKIIYSNDLQAHVCLFSLDYSKRRAGNPKNINLSNIIPKNIDKLAGCVSGSGHDCFLKGITVYIDWNINKIIREQLLRYNFINIISSQSLMHCFDKFKEHEMISKDINSVDDLPLSFKYWLSFSTNYLQLKTIYKQRKHHKREEWQDFCNMIEQLPESFLITGGCDGRVKKAN